MTLTDATFVVTVFANHPWSMLTAVPFWRLCAGTFAIMFLDTSTHELGHGLFALFFGIPVKGLRIGRGPSITFWRWTRCPLQLGIVPKSGRIELGDLPDSRWKRISMYAGGALGSVAAVAGLWICLPRSAWYECIVGTLICVASVLDNLGPRSPDGSAIRALIRDVRASS
jgi:hypothetical protein